MYCLRCLFSQRPDRDYVKRSAGLAVSSEYPIPTIKSEGYHRAEDDDVTDRCGHSSSDHHSSSKKHRDKAKLISFETSK